MSAPIKVAVVGATGRTGSVVVDALLDSQEPKFEVLAISRASSSNSEANQDLAKRGVKIVVADLTGPKADLVKALAGVDIVVSSIIFNRLKDQLVLAEAAKESGVKRFVPCFWGTPAPRGTQRMYDEKLEILDAVKKMYLPYTTIDVGWWSQQLLPPVPSGRVDHAKFAWFKEIPGDGNCPIAVMDFRDIGRWTAKIIVDPRTLNRMVFAYTEVLTLNEITSLMSKLSGEKVELPYRSAESIEKILRDNEAALKANPNDFTPLAKLLVYEYMYSWGVRGDNTPKSADYLGYLDATKLYPDMGGITMENIFRDVLDGKASGFLMPTNFTMDDNIIGE